jgi:hypothetical protein
MEKRTEDWPPIRVKVYLEGMYQGILDHPGTLDEAGIHERARLYFESAGHVGTGTPAEMEAFISGYQAFVDPHPDNRASPALKTLPKPMVIARLRTALPPQLGGGS